MGRYSGHSGKTAIKAFEAFGYVQDHQTGSHVILYHTSRPPLSVPNHRSLAPGLLKGLIRRSGVDNDAFLKELR